MEFEPVIGIEVHAQLKTRTKLFCGCSTNSGEKRNSNVCPVCLGMPGALPVLNKKAVEYAVRAGLALNCTVKELSVFSRKNYFYPDLPKGYQISQFDLPVCENGSITIDVDNRKKTIGIQRIHMEEDAGKLIHQGSASIAGADYSLVDLNRACVPLIEIVSEPDIRSAREARVYVEALKLILQHTGVCDGNLEEGSLRADVNISIRPLGQEKLGTRAEVKNLNSFRSLERAATVEIERQKALIISGGKVVQQTRNWDDASQKTTALRSKEEAHDYRYFQEPDLIPLRLPVAMIREIKNSMPELPVKKMERYKADLGLNDFNSYQILVDCDMNRYFEECLLIKEDIEPSEICKWILGDLNALVKDGNSSFSECKVTPEKLITLVKLIKSGKISGKIAKEVIKKMYETGADPENIVKESGVEQISDTDMLQAAVDKVLAANPDVVLKIKAGKTNSANFLMGQVMRETRGQAQPDLVRKLILDTVNKG